MKVREVYPGSNNDSYVVLQMLFTGENAVGGHDLVLYGPTGTAIDTFVFGGGVPNGSHGNNTILVGDTGVQASFGVAPDDHTDANLNIPAAGGAVCWSDGTPPDCVSWGSFSGSLPSSAGTPASPGGITAGKALHRSIAAGCATYLETSDDTNSSVADFSEQNPLPRNNAAAPTEALCNAPNTTIEIKPPTRTNSTDAEFTFSATPANGASFECKLDSASFAPCTTPVELSSLDGDNAASGTSHTYEVRAKNANGTDSSPAKHTWTVDTVAPTATIGTAPANPSAGTSAAFSFTANEAVSGFQCSLAKGAAADSFSACSSPKTYLSLADDTYSFKVRATDQAGNQGLVDSHQWTVDNSLADTTPPETTIKSKPLDPSESSSASFAYESNEPGSTFECKLDDAAFSSCPSAGVAYSGLANGSHTFQVRATDEFDNTDATPAGFSWTVAVPNPIQPDPAIPSPLPPAPPAPAPTPETTITAKPGAVTKDRTPSFRFRSSVSGSTYECKVDRGAFKSCSSPFTTKSLGFGRHSVEIRAKAAGVVDPTPARSAFKVAKPKRKRSR